MSLAKTTRAAAIFVGFVVAAIGFALPAHAADANAVTITGVDVTASPDVTVTVAVQGDGAAALDKDAFTLDVGGERREMKLTGLPSDPMQVELVIDTSGSMVGPPLDAAKDAARTLVERLPAGVQIGVIGFGDAPYEVLKATADRQAALTAIDGMQAGGGTALYDALVTAADTLKLDRRGVVLLTDGKDTASAGTLEHAVDALRLSPTSFFSVVLDTPDVDIAAAEAFAAAAGGSVSRAADPSALVGVYEAIAAQLSASYQLSFRATQIGQTGVVVRVELGGETIKAETATIVPAAVASEPSGLSSTWVKWLGVLALVAALAMTAFIFVTHERNSRPLSHRRVRRATRGAGVSSLTSQATAFAERSLDRSGKRRGLERALENAGIDIRTGEFLLLVGVGAFSAFALGLLFGGVVLALVFGAAVVFGARGYLSHRAQRRRRKFGDQLEQTLPLLAGSLRAGFGLMQGLDAVARESESPTADEFRRLVAETRLGRDLGESLEAMAERLGNEDFTWVVQAIAIHQQVGGDLAQVLDNVHATIRDRNQVRRQVSALSAEGRLSAQILFVLPLAMGLYISVTNPKYMNELTGTGFGKGMLGGAGVLMILGGLWMRRIVRPEY